MANYNAITNAQIKEMQELRAAGFSRSDIAKELGVSKMTVSRHAPSYKFISDKDVKKMEELRQMGLSNSKIAMELGCAYTSVLKYLGKQPDMVKAEYGAIISHATGESFVKEAKEPPQKRALLKTTKTSIELQGHDFTYKVTSDGEITILHPTGFATNLTENQFYIYMSELCELGDWLSKNTKSHDKQPSL